MRYHFEKPAIYRTNYGELYCCDHPLYDQCTLFEINGKGLAVIQQKFHRKQTWWQEIDPWLTDSIYINENFYPYFQTYAKGPDINGLYPTVTVRQMMYALKMKPIKKQSWETVFDRKYL